MYQNNNNIKYMIRNDMHQYNSNIKCMIQNNMYQYNSNIKDMMQNMKQRKEIKIKINQPIISIIILTYIIITVQLII